MTNLKTVVWAQEEPRNNGAWFFVDPLIEACLEKAVPQKGAGQWPTRPKHPGRSASAATATRLANPPGHKPAALVHIGSARCRDREWQSVDISGVAVALTK